MVSYLDLLNEARARQRSTPISSSSIASSSGDSILGVQAVNATVAHFRRSSVDMDFSEPVTDVVTTAAVSTLTSPTGDSAWNPQLIKEIKFVDSSQSNNLLDVPLVTVDRAKELENALTTQGKPLWFYVSQGVVRVIPVPDQAYTLKVFYQTTLKRITSSNITDTVLEPEDVHEILVDGIYAQLRRGESDPEWPTLWEEYKREASKGYIRNKYNQKSAGKRLFRMRISRDRNL